MKFLKEISETNLKNTDKEILLINYKNNFKLIDVFVEKSLLFLEEIKNRSFNVGSAYLKLPKKISHCYVRAGFNNINKFESHYFCVSNIYISEKYQGKHIFSLYIAIMTSICKQKDMIFYIENPLEERFKLFLNKVGFSYSGEGITGDYVFIP